MIILQNNKTLSSSCYCYSLSWSTIKIHHHDSACLIHARPKFSEQISIYHHQTLCADRKNGSTLQTVEMRIVSEWDNYQNWPGLVIIILCFVLRKRLPNLNPRQTLVGCSVDHCSSCLLSVYLSLASFVWNLNQSRTICTGRFITTEEQTDFFESN